MLPEQYGVYMPFGGRGLPANRRTTHGVLQHFPKMPFRSELFANRLLQNKQFVTVYTHGVLFCLAVQQPPPDKSTRQRE